MITASVMPTCSARYVFASSQIDSSTPFLKIVAGSFQFSQVITFKFPPTFDFFSIPFVRSGTKSPKFLPPTDVNTTSASAIASLTASISEKRIAFAPVTTQFFSGFPKILTVYCPRSLIKSTRPSNFSTKVNGILLKYNK